jgi:hypothetical protein
MPDLSRGCITLDVDHALGNDDGPLYWSARWSEISNVSY